MALHLAYTLYDIKALTYNAPFFTMNDALAKRMLSELVTDPNTIVGRHPSDYKLYKIGMYDDATGIFDRLSVMEHVIDAIALVPPPPAMANLFDPARDARGSANGYFAASSDANHPDRQEGAK
nr:MAG: nonstructural protein [Microvirus sp.]